MSNPLIAAPQDDTTAVTGIGIAEAAQGLAQGISGGDWVEAGLGAVGVGLEVLSMVIDPVGTVAAYGVSWLMEHVEPLREALDWFAGDPPVIRSFSQTWANVSGEVAKVATDLGTEAGGAPDWSGPAADAYRGNAAQTADAIGGMGALADGISAGVMIMGEVVAAVRELIRDLVAEVVGKLITWALEAVATLGLATPLIVAQATSTIAKVTNRIADLVRKLVKTIGNVTPRIRKVVDKLGEIMEKLGKLGRKADGPGGGTSPASASPAPKAEAPTVREPDGVTTPSSSSPDPTAPSGATTPSGGPTRSPDPGGSSSNRPADPNDTKTPEADRVCENDPIDVVTGEMVLSAVDVDLPGVLPLVLTRTHVSSYRAGLSFGPSWASTVDQRLEFDDRGVVFLAEDGMALVYPVPPAAGPVLPDVGPRWPLSRTESGFMVEPRGTGRALHFTPGAAAAHLAAVVDRNGNRVDLDRDGTGALTAIRHSGGYHLDVLGERGRITEFRLRVEGGSPVTAIRYRYDERGRLTEVVNSSGRPLRFDYDHADRITEWTDRNGEWYRYRYDERGRCVANEGSGGFLDGAFHYEDGLTRFTDALGNTTTYLVGANRRVHARTDPLGHTTTQQWDAADRLVARTDALGNTTKFIYDEAGDLVATTRPDGAQALAEYDAHGRVTAFVGPDGAVWRQEFDERGNLVAETDPVGAVTRYTHDGRGHRVAVTDALGNVRRIETNRAGVPIAVTAPGGAVTRYARDAFGRAAVITDPVGGRTRYSWTVEGRLLARTRPDGAVERWQHDAEGNAFEHVDPMGRVTRTSTTHFNLPAAEVRPDGTVLRFGYDATLRLTSVTNAQGAVWHYEYDAAGNLVREVDFTGRVLTYRYDAAGRLTERVNGAGQATTFTRDVLGRIIRRRSDDRVSTVEYDLLGRVSRARNADADLVYTRDALGRVLAESVNGRAVTSAYDPLGRRVRRNTPTGAESAWDYDGDSRPTHLRVGDRSMAFRHDRAGQEITRTLGNGAVLEQTWDANHRLVGQAVRAGGDPLHREYRYQADDNLAEVDDRSGASRRYRLDPMGRVTAVEGATWREQYAYDAAGNLASAETEYAGALGRASGGTRHEHDPQGRVVLRQRERPSGEPETWRYEWDADDRLVAAVTPDGTRWSYRYDPLGRRIAKLRHDRGGGVAERVDFAWDGATLAEQTHSGGRTTTWEFDPGSFRPLSQSERGQDGVDARFYAIVTDIVGTPTELIDEDGERAWRCAATLWGEPLEPIEQRADTPLRFPGQYFDAETGLHYNYLRHYDPGTAGYTSPDPLGLFGGPSPHGYVHNPTGWTDALGLTESGDIEFLDPNDINFSQRSITTNDYAAAMRDGQWDWNRSPVHVVEIDGQLVSYDNRRLDAAREAGVPVGVQRVDPNAPHPESTTGKTWAEKFQERFRDPRNRLDGEPVPDTGLNDRPTPIAPGCGGGRRRRQR